MLSARFKRNGVFIDFINRWDGVCVQHGSECDATELADRRLKCLCGIKAEPEQLLQNNVSSPLAGQERHRKWSTGGYFVGEWCFWGKKYIYFDTLAGSDPACSTSATALSPSQIRKALIVNKHVLQND